MASSEYRIKVGIIGGTGLDQDPDLIENKSDVQVPETPFGQPSDTTLIGGQINGVEVVVMGRHGKKHDINPSNVNYRANLWTLKQLGCTHVLVTTACGSLKLEVKPGHFGILDQYIDRTAGRQKTFYKVIHVPQAKPYDPVIQEMLLQACQELKYDVHPGLTAVCIEGPRFSTLAESKLYKSWGCDTVNMTICPEAPLAAELGLIYGSLALITDYDCWHQNDEESVSVELVTQRLVDLGKRARQVLSSCIGKIGAYHWNERIAQKQQDAKSAIMCE